MPTFNPARFMRFMKFELISRRAELLFPLAIPVCLYSMWAFWRLANGGTVEEWATYSFIIGLLLGLGATAKAFANEIEPNSASFYLMLPASHTERFAVRWLLSFGLSFVGQLFLLSVLALAYALIGKALGRIGPTWNWPDLNFLGQAFGSYLIAHSLFFAGSIFFKKNALIKTVLLGMSYGAVLAVVTLIIRLSGMMSHGSFDPTQLIAQMTTEEGWSTRKILSVAAWQVLLPLLLYVATFFRSKENEVRG